MKRLTLCISAIILLALPSLRAQDNPYSIDNVCYEYFQICEALVGETSNDAFEIAAGAFLKRAQEVGDKKALAILSTCRLKRTIRFAREMGNLDKANESVEKQRRESMSVSLESGYIQYFYYAYELTQTYYINTGQEIHAQNLLSEMMDYAARNNDEYGMWQSQRYIAMLYQRQNDLFNARKYLKRVIDIWDNTSDPWIKRQSLTRQSCDLADTYYRGSDSARLYYNKAEQTALTAPDTLRFTFYKAQLAALDGKMDEYRQHRNYCLSAPSFRASFPGGANMFDSIDAIIAGKPLESFTPNASKVKARQQMIYLRDLAISRNRQDLAAWLGTSIISTLYQDINRLNNLKMEEMSAMMQNSQMRFEASRQRRIRTWMWVAIGLLAAGLGVALAALYKEKNKTKHIK